MSNTSTIVQLNPLYELVQHVYSGELLHMAEKGKVQVQLGRQVRRWRLAKGWSQEDLAERLKTRQTAISRIERGANAVSIEVAVALAEAFDVTLDELLPLQQDPTLARWIRVWATLEPEARDEALALFERLLGENP